MLQAKADVRKWIEATQNQIRSPSRETTSQNPTLAWSRPPISYIKCNFDAKFDMQTNQTLGGWVIRDHTGTTKAWGSSDLYTTGSPL